MVETESLISFDKLMKKIAVFLFIKDLSYLRITILNYLLVVNNSVLIYFLGRKYIDFRITFKLKI